MTRIKRPFLGLIILLLTWAGVGLIISRVPPERWWVEAQLLTLLLLALILAGARLFGNFKKAVVVAAAVVGLLLMNRLRILDWTTLGLWLLVMGLLSLIN